MEKLHKRDIQTLAAVEAPVAVTMYIPMHTTASPPHITQNQIRFKNMTHALIEQLRQQDPRQPMIERLEVFSKGQLEDVTFWEHQTPALLICLTADETFMYHLPIDSEEYAAIDTHFHLAPVHGLLEDEQPFYLLSVAQHNPQLYQGDMYGLRPVGGIELPADVKTALNIDEPNQKSENQGTAAGPSGDGSGFNGRGGARNPQEADRLRFFRMIDKLLCAKLDHSIPLLLGGTETEIVEYRTISKYPQILQSILAGNHEADHLSDLFEIARAMVHSEVVMPSHQKIVDEYQRVQGAHPERVANQQQSIQAAAKQGRVDKLLMMLSRDTTDTIRDESKSVVRLTFPGKKDSQALNDIARQVWQMSGKIINLLPTEMPNQQLMVARLRY
jgi:hypothetical protein